MAKTDEPYRISAEQLLTKTRNRNILKLTLSADIALEGGIPLGSTVLVGGSPKTGKTTVCLQYAANAQRDFGCKVFMYPIEGRFTHKVLEQTRNIKTDIDSFEVIMPPAITDKDGEVVGYKKQSAEKWWEIIGETIVENPNSVHIVDSIANMAPEKEVSEGMGYQSRGRKCQLESEFCRKYGDAIVANNVTLFLLAQIQANTSGYGSPYQIKVGNQIQHQADIILFTRKIEKYAPDSNGKIVGHYTIYEILESALGAPFGELKLPLKYGYGIDDIQDIMTHALTWDIIKKSASWYVLPFEGSDEEGFTYNPESTSIKIQGENKLRNWLFLNEDCKKIIESKVREQIFGTETTDA